MIIEVTTENHSLYRLDKEAMTWERAIAGPPNKYFPVRTASGKLLQWPTIKLGQPMQMIGPPLNPLASIRVLETSRVIQIEEVYEHKSSVQETRSN